MASNTQGRTPNSEDIGALVRELYAGSSEAPCRIARVLRVRSMRLCRIIGLQEADAEDIAQNAVVQTWLRITSEPSLPVEAVGAWHSRATVSLCAEFRRSSARRRELERSAAARSPHELAADHQPILSELRSGVRGSVRRLPEVYAAVIKLHYFEHRTVRSIAQAQGVPSATVKSRLRRARRLFFRFSGSSGARQPPR